jgi:hypothetical protein
MFDLERESDVQLLLDSLGGSGLKPYVWDSGGGIEFVCVDVDIEPGIWVAVAAGSNGHPCEVGILSDNPEVQRLFDWQHCSSLEEASLLIARFAQAA